MCGRFASSLPAEQIARLFRVAQTTADILPSWNVAPTREAMVIRRHPESGERRLDTLVWGLVPHFTKDLKAARRPINARSETAAVNRLFGGALARRRCLVPATAFYEWRQEAGGKQPFAIARQDGGVLAFAGLWESWRDPAGGVLRSFAILTTAANGCMATLHERMPVILEPADWSAWLDEPEAGEMAAGDIYAGAVEAAISRTGNFEAMGAKASFNTLMRPAADGVVKIWKVGRQVNSTRNDGPGLLDPATAPAYASGEQASLDINPA